MNDLDSSPEIQRELERIRRTLAPPVHIPLIPWADGKALLDEIDRLHRIWEHNSAASVANEQRLRDEVDQAVRLLRRARTILEEEDDHIIERWRRDLRAAFGEYLLPGESRLSPDGKGRIARPPKVGAGGRV